MGLFGWGEKEEKKPEEAATTSGGGTAAAAPPPAPAAAPGSAAAAGTTTGTAAPTVGTAPAAATGTASATATGAAGTAPVGGTAAGGEAAVKQIDPPQVEPLTSKAEREQMEAEARKKAEEKADRRAKAQLRFHTCGNLDCDVMRLPPWLPRNPERNPAKKAAPAPRRIALHEGWPHLFIETGDGPRAFSAAPCVTVCMTAREKRIVVEGYPHEWLVGGEGTPSFAGGAHVCHGCLRPSVVALTLTMEEAKQPAKLLLSAGPVEARNVRCLRPSGLQFRLPHEQALGLFARSLMRDVGYLAGPPPPPEPPAAAPAPAAGAPAPSAEVLEAEAKAAAAKAKEDKQRADAAAKVTEAAVAQAAERVAGFTAALVPGRESDAEEAAATLRLTATLTPPYLTHPPSQPVPLAGTGLRWPNPPLAEVSPPVGPNRVGAGAMPYKALRQELAKDSPKPLHLKKAPPPVATGAAAAAPAGTKAWVGSRDWDWDKGTSQLAVPTAEAVPQDQGQQGQRGTTALATTGPPTTALVEFKEAELDQAKYHQKIYEIQTPTDFEQMLKDTRAALDKVEGKAHEERRLIVATRLQASWRLERAQLLRRLCKQLQAQCQLIGERQPGRRVKPAPKGSADGKPEQSPFPLSEKELREVATVFLCEEHLLYPVGDDAWAAKLPSDVLLLLRAIAKAAAEGGLELTPWRPRPEAPKEWRPRASTDFFAAPPPPAQGEASPARASWMTFKLPQGASWFAPPAPAPAQ